MIHKINTFLALLILMCFTQQALASPTRITDFRFSSSPEKIRLVFDASGPVNYDIQESQNEITINIKNAKLIGLLNKTWLHKTPVSKVQSEQIGKNLLLTLSLKKSIKLKHFILKNPCRLVLDMYGSKASASKTKASTTKKSPPPSVPKKLHYVTIAIDPGHGGKDPGAIGNRKTCEKDIALAVAKALQNKINQTKGFRAVLTRNSDCYVTLRQRLDIARRNKADMFVSIHADAYDSSTSRGASIFALSQKGATSEAARWLAKKENESELGKTISDKNDLLRSVLIDLAQSATISASLEMGDLILSELKLVVHLHSPQVEQAAFVVLKSPDIPSLLIETGFISDPHEERNLRSSEYQQKLAELLAAGIVKYFKRKPPQGAYLSKEKNDDEVKSTALQESLLKSNRASNV